MTKFALLLCAAMALSATGAGAGERLSGAELKAEYSGVRLYANTPSGRVVQHDYNADGTITGVVGVKDRGKDLDKGSWWVEGDTLCREWAGWRKQKPGDCFTVVNQGGTATWYRADGSVYRIWRVARSAPGSQLAYGDQPRCEDVGGYEAYMARSGKTCQFTEVAEGGWD